MVYGVWWFPTAVRIRLSQPPARLGLGLGLSLAKILPIIGVMVLMSFLAHSKEIYIQDFYGVQVF